MQLNLHAASGDAAVRAGVQGLGDGRSCRVASARSRRPTSGSASARRPRGSSFREPANRARADELWQTTCFEAFLEPRAATAYREFNFSPSGDWAAYDFDGYREGMAERRGRAPPYIRMEDNFTWWTLGATIAVDAGKRLATRPVRGDRGAGRDQVLLGARPSRRTSPISTHPACFAAQLPVRSAA